MPPDMAASLKGLVSGLNRHEESSVYARITSFAMSGFPPRSLDTWAGTYQGREYNESSFSALQIPGMP